MTRLTRDDAPYVALTLFFGMVIFGAGRYSVPTPVVQVPQVVVLHDAPAPTSSVIVVSSAADPLPTVWPVTALPEAPSAAPVDPRYNAPAPVLAPKPAVTAPVEPVRVPVKPDDIVLEEVPENPYQANARPTSP